MPYKRTDSKFWWISWTDAQGVRQRESAGTENKREAEAIERRRQLEAFEQKRFGVEPDRLFEDLMDIYVDRAGVKDEERVLYATAQLLKGFKGAVLNTLSRKDIAEYIATRKAQPGTIRRELGLFRAAINWAKHDLEWNIPNPVYLPPKPEPKLRWLTHAEYQSLLAAAGESRNPQLRRFIRLAVSTGMRKTELERLRIEQVDLNAKMIYFTPDQVKSGRFEGVPISGPAQEELTALIGDRKEGLVFDYRGGGSVRKAFESAVKRAGLKGVTIHTLRHTFASWLVQKGVPLKVVQELMRHRDITSTLIYAHVTADNARDGINMLDA